MALDYTARNWYWHVEGQSGRYSSRAAAYVAIDNADYLAFVAAGGTATYIATEALLWEVLGQQYPPGLPDNVTGSLTYYVRTDGNDRNSGLENTAAGAFLTLQRAWEAASATRDAAGITVTIRLANGTYTTGINATTKPASFGEIFIEGDRTTPSNVIIACSSADCIEIGSASTAWIRGVRMTNSGGSAIHTYRGGVVIFEDVEFGACSEAHLFVDNEGQAIANGPYKIITGTTPIHFFAHTGGFITAATRTVTLTGTPNFSSAFAVSYAGGKIEAVGMTFTGSATGRRFIIESGGAVVTGSSSLTYLPGDTAGELRGGFLDNRSVIGTAFTPTYLGTATAGSTTYTTQNGTYWRLGNLIFFTAVVAWSAATGTGQAAVGGLPYNAAFDAACSAAYSDGVTFTSAKQLTLMLVSTESRARLYNADPGGGSAGSVLVEAAGELRISGFYVADGLY